MKLRITPRHLPDHTNPNWPSTSRPLYCRHNPSLLLHRPHMPERTVWLTNPQPTRKRSLILLYLHLPPHRPRTLLRLLPIQRNLKHRHYPPNHPHSNRLRRLRPAMRPNILLRSHSHHQPILGHPLHWPNSCRMSLRRLLSRQPYTNPILRTTLPPPIHNYRPHPNSPHLPPRIWLKQPTRHRS